MSDSLSVNTTIYKYHNIINNINAAHDINSIEGGENFTHTIQAQTDTYCKQYRRHQNFEVKKTLSENNF